MFFDWRLFLRPFVYVAPFAAVLTGLAFAPVPTLVACVAGPVILWALIATK